jgi:hypothetical protein
VFGPAYHRKTLTDLDSSGTLTGAYVRVKSKTGTPATPPATTSSTATAPATTSSTTNPKAEAIMANLINLGHILGLTVTAEGVETAAQAALLTRMRCDLAQGWQFGHPAPADQITALLTTLTPPRPQ